MTAFERLDALMSTQPEPRPSIKPPADRVMVSVRSYPPVPRPPAMPVPVRVIAPAPRKTQLELWVGMLRWWRS